MTCVHGWRPPSSLSGTAATQSRPRCSTVALGPPPPSGSAPTTPPAHAQQADTPSPEPTGRHDGHPAIGLWEAHLLVRVQRRGVSSVRFRRRFRGSGLAPSAAAGGRVRDLLRLFSTAYLGSCGQARCSTRGHLCRLLLASGGGHRQVRRPVSLPVTGWSRFRGKSCRCASTSLRRRAPRCSRRGLLFWFGCSSRRPWVSPSPAATDGGDRTQAHTARVPRFGGGWVATPRPPDTGVPSPCTDSPLRGRSGRADARAARVLRRRFAREVGCRGEVHALLSHAAWRSRKRQRRPASIPCAPACG